MLQNSMIEESACPWSSHILTAPKPDRSLQICNNFRRLNQVSEFDFYPLPWVDDLVGCLGRAQFISTLDFTKGY